MSLGRRVGCAIFGILGLLIAIAAFAPGDRDSNSTDAKTIVSQEILVDASTLFSAYQANEARAQQMYGDNPIRLTGTVAGVDLDLMDEPVVKLKTSSDYESVQARIAGSAKAEAASLSKGDNVLLHCKSVSEVIGTPILDDCTFRL